MNTSTPDSPSRAPVVDLDVDPAETPPSSGPRRRPGARAALAAATALVVAGGAVTIGTHGSGQQGLGSATQDRFTGATPPDSKPSPSPATSPLGEPKTASQWQFAVETFDLYALEGTLQPELKTLNGWQAGRVTDANVKGETDHVIPLFVDARQAVDARKPVKGTEPALDAYRRATRLYVEFGRLAQLAISTPKGPLRTQLQRDYLRVKALGDAVFNQAAVLLAPVLPPDPSVGNTIVIPAPEVPDWASLGLAAGPPLDVTPATKAPQTYQQDRPQEPFDQWAGTVGALGIPTATDAATAITSGTAQDLRALSDRYARAVDALRAAPDPTKERATSVRVRLGLLVDAEATRAAQTATLVPAERDQLIAVAQGLALIGDSLWDQRLGARTSGFPASLLTDRRPDEVDKV